MAATFVLVHGGGHGGWCYQSVARLPALIPQTHPCTMFMRWRDVDALRDQANGRLWATGHEMMLTEPGWVAEKLMLAVPED